MKSTCTIPLALAQEDYVQSLAPTATPVPPGPPSEIRNQTFLLYNDTTAAHVCLRMIAVISINITYIDQSGVSSQMVTLISSYSQPFFHYNRIT